VSPRAKGLSWVSLAYVVAIAAGCATFVATRAEGAIGAVGLGYLASILAIFVFSRAFSNTSFFDAWWMVAPVALLPALYAMGVAVPARFALVSALVVAWAVRLTWNWIRGWPGLHHEDWRYVEMKEKTGRAYWLVSLTALHLFPGALVYLGSLPLVVAARGATPLGWLDAAAALVTGGAIAIEAVADEQLRAFAASSPPRGASCERGLWRFSRHPNYFGEIGFWTGLFLFALAADPEGWWTAVGPLSMIALFVFGTIPMMEKRQLARRPEAYADYQRRVSMLVPWPPRRS
jgi:steroid 5-alpha reductase family enzyme